MKVGEMLLKCTTFDPVSIDRFKIYVHHDFEINNQLTDCTEPTMRGSWSVNSTYLVPRDHEALSLVRDMDVAAIGIEDEHTLGIIIER